MLPLFRLPPGSGFHDLLQSSQHGRSSPLCTLRQRDLCGVHHARRRQDRMQGLCRNPAQPACSCGRRATARSSSPCRIPGTSRDPLPRWCGDAERGAERDAKAFRRRTVRRAGAYRAFGYDHCPTACAAGDVRTSLLRCRCGWQEGEGAAAVRRTIAHPAGRRTGVQRADGKRPRHGGDLPGYNRHTLSAA